MLSSGSSTPRRKSFGAAITRNSLPPTTTVEDAFRDLGDCEYEMMQSKRWTRAFLYLASFVPDALYGWPIVLFCRLFWGEALCWEDGVLRCRAKEDSWLQRTYGDKWGAVTLSPHAIVYMQMTLWPEELDEPRETQRHEHIHVEQGESAQLSAFLEALVWLVVLLIVGEPVWAGIVSVLLWGTGHARKSGAANLTAILRGEKGSADGKYGGGYIGAHTEEAARTGSNPDHDRHRRD